MSGRNVLLICGPVMLTGTALAAVAGQWLAAIACLVLMAVVLAQSIAVRREMRQREARWRP